MTGLSFQYYFALYQWLITFFHKGHKTGMRMEAWQAGLLLHVKVYMRG